MRNEKQRAKEKAAARAKNEQAAIIQDHYGLTDLPRPQEVATEIRSLHRKRQTCRLEDQDRMLYIALGLHWEDPV